MRIPHRDSRANRVAMYLHAMDGATKAQCITAFSEEPAVKIREAINYMFSENMLSERDGVFKVKPYLAVHYSQCDKTDETLPIVPPRTAPEFRPLSAKNMAHLAPRREQIREVSFLNGSIGFSYGYFAQ